MIASPHSLMMRLQRKIPRSLVSRQQAAGHLAHLVMQKIRKLKKKLPDEKGHFLLEGIRLTQEAEKSEIPLQAVFYTSSFQKSFSGKELLQRLRKSYPVYQISESSMKSISLEETPPGLLAFGQFFQKPFSPAGKNIAVLWGIQDPGNAGTLFRIAEGTNSALWFSEDSVRPLHPKVIKASMGSLFRVPFARGNPHSLLKTWKEEGRAVIGTRSSGEIPYTAFDWRTSFVLLLGSEAAGLPKISERYVDSYVSIPLKGELDSLNVAVAGAILLFEAERRRCAEEK